MSGHRWAVGSALAALLALNARPAHASSVETTGAVYAVDGACPSRNSWLLALRQRLPPLLQTHPLIETLSVHIEKVKTDGNVSYTGELGPIAGTVDTSRRVHGATCAEVVDALSFIGALGLERAARLNDGESPALQGASAGPAPSDARIDARTASEPALPPSRLELSASAYVLLQGGLMPAGALALGAALRLGWHAPSWQPLLLLGAYVSVPEETTAAGGNVRFEHWSTHAVGCPWRFPAGGAFGLRPCIELDVGQTRGEGRGVTAATERSAPWLSTGAELRAELRVVPALELGAALAGVVPLWHSRFYLQPDLTSFETPALGYRAEAYTCVLF